jgi:hypothetical protein
MQEAKIQQLIQSTIPFSSGLTFMVNKVDGESSGVTFHTDDNWSRAGGSISGRLSPMPPCMPLFWPTVNSIR